MAGQHCEPDRAGALYGRPEQSRRFIIPSGSGWPKAVYIEKVGRPGIFPWAWDTESRTAAPAASRESDSKPYAVSLYCSIAILAPPVGRGNGTKTIPRCRSCTSVQTPAHSSHNQYRSTRRAFGRIGDEGAAVTSPLETPSVSTRKSLPCRRWRKGLEHREFAQWLSTDSSAQPLTDL